MTERPVLVYDGACDFCATWVARWKRVTGDRVDYVAWQQPDSRTSGIDRERARGSVHLVEPSGRVSSGAEAVFRSLAAVPGHGRWLALYLGLPGFAMVSEWVYGVIARNRGFLSRLPLIGQRPPED